MNAFKATLISELIKIQALQLRVDQPFVFTSGIKSPIYIDARLTISRPSLRKLIAKEIAKSIKENYPDVEVIAGVATGSIAMAAWVSDILNLPMIYWRKPKGYGHNKSYEGSFNQGNKIVIIEDVVSKGTSSLTAASDLLGFGAEILGVNAIYSHQLSKSILHYNKVNIKLSYLCGFSDLIIFLETSKLLQPSQIQILKDWHKDPLNWKI